MKDSVCVGQRSDGGEERVLLFLQVAIMTMIMIQMIIMIMMMIMIIMTVMIKIFRMMMIMMIMMIKMSIMVIFLMIQSCNAFSKPLHNHEGQDDNSDKS